MARIKVQTPATAGTTLAANKQEDDSALVWVANTRHKYRNTGKEILRIVKGAGAATMKAKTHAPNQYGLPLPDRTIAIPANSDRFYRPLSPGAHNERAGADEGYTGIEFDNIAGLKVDIIAVGEEVR